MGRPPLSAVRKPGPRARAAAPATNKELREASLLKLEESAITCFLDAGVRTTSVEQIAARAGLTKGGFYFHFPRKEAMVAHILSRIEREYVVRAIETADQAPTAKDKLVALLHQQVLFAREHRQEVALLVLMSLEFRSDGEIGEQVRAVYDRIRNFVKGLFESGQAKNEFTKALSAQALSHFYVAVHDGFLVEILRAGDLVDGPALVRVYRETLLRGVAVEEAAARPIPRRQPRRGSSAPGRPRTS
ncbi:MAG: TetR/AcrR family transcriptional regulator [Rubrivivax sp.]